MITIKCNEQEKEMFERLFCRISNGNIDCNDLDLHCDCCPSKCSGSKEVEYQVENSNSKLVYISGAITGVDNYLDTFKQSESHIKSLGYEVINPAEILSHLPKSTPYEVYMNMSYEMLSTCDYIYMIDGWEESKGANLELDYAKEHGIKELRFENIEELDKKNYILDFYDSIAERNRIRIAPNLKRYSEYDSEPIYLEIKKYNAEDIISFTELSIEQTTWLRDSLSEILNTVEEMRENEEF